MNSLKRRQLMRVAIAGLALAGMNLRAIAADVIEFNLVQYELSFGQGRTQHSFYLSNFAPGDRFGEFAFDESGAIRMPLYSTNAKVWTLFRNNASEGSDGSLAGSIASGIAALGLLVAMGYGIASGVKDIEDSFDYDFGIPATGFVPPTSTTSSKPAKK
jgi:hypothetical protein